MKNKFLLLVASLISASTLVAQEKGAQVIAKGIKNPESVAVAFDGRIFVSEIGEFGKDGDGRIVEIVGDQVKPFAVGLDDPKGMAVVRGGKGASSLVVTDKDRIWKIDGKGKATVWVAADKFPTKPQFLNDIAVDEKGVVCVSDSGDLKGNGGAVYRIDQKGKVTLLVDSKKNPKLKTKN